MSFLGMIAFALGAPSVTYGLSYGGFTPPIIIAATFDGTVRSFPSVAGAVQFPNFAGDVAPFPLVGGTVVGAQPALLEGLVMNVGLLTGLAEYPTFEGELTRPAELTAEAARLDLEGAVGGVAELTGEVSFPTFEGEVQGNPTLEGPVEAGKPFPVPNPS